ncbi:MAG TPA: class I SAM-dependent methyltransferase, partial [Candidatus Acidoferrum sp.]|nr:class I SAM-dependent methyltransferase [Candidatus Acidoferrum sp.]
PAGVHAETCFNTIKTKEITTIEAEPLTGRTHQIRVHAADHGFPILGDELYGGTSANRIFLHARELSFAHPATDEVLCFDCSPDWDARRTFIDPEMTGAFRLIHGASDGWPGLYVEKLGDYLLVETESQLDPAQRQQVEELARRHNARGVYHKLLDRKVRIASAAQASPRPLFGDIAPEQFTIRENGLNFELSFDEGYSVGLFLDQRDNRRRFLLNHVAAEFSLFPQGIASARVLNVFAYTCGFSVAAAKGGAHTTSLDLSKKYLEWGRRNFALNGIDPAQHDFIFGDAFDWMRRLGKKGRSFDCIVLDPPTFSKSKESGTWRAEDDYGKLVVAALPLLNGSGVIFCSSNAARVDPAEFCETIRVAVNDGGRKIVQRHYVPQPPDFPIARDEPAYLKTIWTRIQ